MNFGNNKISLFYEENGQIKTIHGYGKSSKDFAKQHNIKKFQEVKTPEPEIIEVIEEVKPKKRGRKPKNATT